MGVGAGAMCWTLVVMIPPPEPLGVPEPEDGCSGFGLGVLTLGGMGGPRPPQLAAVDVHPERPPHALDAREVLLCLGTRPLLELVGRQPLVGQL